MPVAEGGFVTVARVAEALGVTRETVRLWVLSGRMQAIRTPGGNYRVPAAELDQILGRKVRPAADAAS